VGDRDDVDLRAAGRATWRSLPMLLLASAAIALVVALALLVAAWWPPAGAAAGALAAAPLLLALVRCADDVVAGRDVPSAEYLHAVTRLAPRAAGTAVVPCVLAALTAVAVLAHARGAGAVFLVPAGLGTTATVLVLAAALVLLPLRARHRAPGVGGWLLAWHVLARRPVPFLAAAAYAGAGIWWSLTWSNGLFLLVPAPFALILAAAYRSSPAEQLLVAD